MIFWLYHGDGGVGIAGWGYRLFGIEDMGGGLCCGGFGCGAVGRVWGSLGASWSDSLLLVCLWRSGEDAAAMAAYCRPTVGLLLLLPSSITLYSPRLRLSGSLVISTIIVRS